MIATAVVVLVLVALNSTMTIVLRNQRDSANQQQATKYGQEAVEWMRKFRDNAGWATFYATVNAAATKCMKAVPTTVDAVGYNGATMKNGACTLQTVNLSDIITGDSNGFTRDVASTVVGAAQDDIRVLVTVRWIDGSRTLTATTTIELRKWK
ncbi:MAG TPA: hypothetical protein VFG51_02835 [Candidatus Saccharimonadia bacterium]|nr:hypothetical protein [Candidatus Saccharimonadia bacterium]